MFFIHVQTLLRPIGRRQSRPNTAIYALIYPTNTRSVIKLHARFTIHTRFTLHGTNASENLNHFYRSVNTREMLHKMYTYQMFPWRVWGAVKGFYGNLRMQYI